MKETGRNLIPYQHEDLDDWRQNFKGIRFFDEKLNFTLYGAVDDVWFDIDTEELVVVDYKATSSQKEITLEDAILLSKRDTRRYIKRQLTWFRHNFNPDLILSI